MKTLGIAAAAITILAASCAHAQLCDLNLVTQDESGDRNIPNYRYDAHHTAGGHWQITDTNWRHFAPMVDIDLSKWPNALSAPEQLQGQVAGIMRAKLGCLPWVPYNPQLRRHMTQASAVERSPSAAPIKVSDQPPATKWIRGKLWTPEMLARMTAPSGVFNPMNIAFR